MKITASDVGIIIVNYCGHADTVSCLESLSRLRTPPRRIIVVENGSNDRSADVIQDYIDNAHHATGIEVLKLDDNIGFAGGNNVALRHLLHDQGCSAFWLLNNDTVALPESLDALCETLSGSDKLGACGSLLVCWDDSNTVQCMAGGKINRLIGTSRHLGEGLTTDELASQVPGDTVRSLDYVCGASLLASRTALARVGLLEEAFFLYYEDVEFGLRLKRSGFGLGYSPNSIVRHKEGGSTGAKSSSPRGEPFRSRRIDYLALRNRVWLMRSLFPQMLPLVLASYLGVALTRYRRGQGDRLGLVFRAAWHGLVGRMGAPDQKI